MTCITLAQLEVIMFTYQFWTVSLRFFLTTTKIKMYKTCKKMFLNLIHHKYSLDIFVQDIQYQSNVHTLTGHFIMYTLLVPGWTPFCLQNCLNSSWHRFNKVLETFLRDFGPYWHDSITQLLQICRLHIHDVNLSFHHIPKVLYWIEIWWLWRPFE